MTRDLREALREAANALARVGLRRDADLIARLRALAGAPPTVAELLADVRFVAGTHAIAFTCKDGAQLWIRAGAWKAFTVEVNPFGAHRDAPIDRTPSLYSYDFTQPATLVEVPSVR